MDDHAKNSGRPGLAGITADHRRGWEAGTLSYSAIARELGITKQTVAAHAKRNEWKRAKTQPEPQPQPSAPVRPPTLPQPATAEEAERDRLTLIQANRVALGRALEHMRLPLDLMAIQRAQTVIRAVHHTWFELGHFAPLIQQHKERIPELVVRCMTEKEELLMRARVDAEYLAAFDQPEPYEPNGAERAIEGETAPGNTQDQVRSLAQPNQNGTGSGNSYGAPSRVAGPAGNSDGGLAQIAGPKRGRLAQGSQSGLARFTLPRTVNLPDKDKFRNWLDSLGQRYGLVMLRALLEALGSTDPSLHTCQNREYLIGQVLHRTGDDPDKLRAFTPDVAAS